MGFRMRKQLGLKSWGALMDPELRVACSTIYNRQLQTGLHNLGEALQ